LAAYVVPGALVREERYGKRMTQESTTVLIGNEDGSLFGAIEEGTDEDYKVPKLQLHQHETAAMESCFVDVLTRQQQESTRIIHP
jgi:hypothetical protein